MPKLSAGVLLYRRKPQLEVFLVHPGGPFWVKKDIGAWSLPKGEYDQSEDAWQAARREFTEETGFTLPQGERVALGKVKYSNKILVAWAVEGEVDAQKIKSNTLTIPWPPRSGKQQEFPEVDKAAWYDSQTAKQKLVTAQAQFVERLEEKLR